MLRDESPVVVLGLHLSTTRTVRTCDLTTIPEALHKLGYIFYRGDVSSANKYIYEFSYERLQILHIAEVLFLIVR